MSEQTPTTTTGTRGQTNADGIPAVTEVPVPVGGRALVACDLHLDRDPAPTHVLTVNELIQAIDSWTGPGVLLLNGNTFEPPNAPAEEITPAGPSGGVSVAATLAAHPRLVRAVKDFAEGQGRSVLVLPGDRDADLAWSKADQDAVRTQLGAELALAVDLDITAGAGPRRVRVEGGQQLDPLSARRDEKNGGETPLSYHLRCELLPAVRRAEGASKDRDGWLSGMDQLDDQATFPRFLASRLTYRKLGRYVLLLLIPVVIAIGLRLPALAMAHASGYTNSRSVRLITLMAVAVLLILILLGIVVVAVRRAWLGLAGLSAGEGDREPNRTARDRARELIGDGYAGLITGHTCRPELAHLGGGFYANAGCNADVVTEIPARVRGLGLPPVFRAYHQLSWVELEVGNELHVRLLHARQDAGGATLLERLIGRRPAELGTDKDLRPQLVATFPQGSSWPVQPSGQLQKRRIRRVAGLLVGIAGLISLVSSLSEPLRDRLRDIRDVVPLVVPETASALTALAGVSLLVLARGVRRGQRRAWAVTIGVLLVSVVSNVVKGVDVEEATVALTIAAFLWINRSSFAASTDVPSLRGGLLGWLGALVLTVAAATAGIKVSIVIRRLTANQAHRRFVDHFSITWSQALLATIERMVGVDHVRLPHSLDRFFGPTMAAATIGLALALLVLVFRPVAERRRRMEERDTDLSRARAIVARHGSGTLDYFALRPDKQFFFWGDTVAAYAVYGGVCLVSPDPIGPVTEREPAWRAFRTFVDEHGWALGGLGAGEEWLPIYRATGMHDLYAGDEGVVRIGRFTLEGGRFKSLRQAVNRVAKYGYKITFHDPAHLDADLRAGLERVMTKSRRGDVERGFSMTLGRVFQPDDEDLLLAVVHGPVPEGSPDGTLGEPVAFCQYVPAPGIGGYSLDLMRRDGGEHPNGLIDFAVVETIRYLQAHGKEGLGLNFATMRAVLAGETGSGASQRIQAWLLRRMGDSMQIESLWKFNAKFDPDWQPRYALYDAPENALAVAIAIARAESWWELPVIGRFLVPASPSGPATKIAPEAEDQTSPDHQPKREPVG
jgi:lysylphosphatidylglycerol synthetase-like protein (DUF2156 family)